MPRTCQLSDRSPSSWTASTSASGPTRGPWRTGATTTGSWVTGCCTGSASRTVGRAGYRNRWVRAAEVEGPASPLNEGSNTAVAFLGGRLYSLTETCMPVEITRELDTVRRHDFGGPLPFGFSAHPQRHPRTGEVHAAAYWIEPPYVYHHVLSSSGELIRTEPVDVAGPTSMHTVAITDRWVVFFDLPAIFDLDGGDGRSRVPVSLERGLRGAVGVRPVEGGGIKWMSVDPCYVFHVLNGHDVGDSMLSLELSVPQRVRQGRPRTERRPSNAAPLDGRRRRWSDQGRAARRPAERVPTCRPRRHAAAHRFGYLMAFADGDGEAAFTPTGLLKRDSQRGAGGPRLRAGSRTRRADLRSTLGGRSGG